MDFCRVSAGKMNGGDNQEDQMNGNAARNNMQETVEAMEPVEADWLGLGWWLVVTCAAFLWELTTMATWS